MQYKLTIKVEAQNEDEVRRLGQLLQKVLTSADAKDVVTLLEKVAKNPSLIKTAIRFA